MKVRSKRRKREKASPLCLPRAAGRGGEACLGCRALGLKVGVRAGVPQQRLTSQLGSATAPQACLLPPTSCVDGRQARGLESCRSVFLSWSRASGRSLGSPPSLGGPRSPGGPARTFLHGVAPVEPPCICQGFPSFPPPPAVEARRRAQGAGRVLWGVVSSLEGQEVTLWLSWAGGAQRSRAWHVFAAFVNDFAWETQSQVRKLAEAVSQPFGSLRKHRHKPPEPAAARQHG